ncbi:NAD(P)-binding domain-containing protein [Verrucomicrobium spinosum]|uniref:NAD(P)-binding domain-containing protein n=1 Tax=Verrucomicrobium spinosum TaxID=2736 RepID=UPI0009465993|nr:NAD(P)-binding domain-containing protein [Verrucomicrobium spinosum]
MFGSKNNSVGVIGLGIIGSRVAERLRNADFNVYVWNRSIKPEPNFMASPAEVAEVAQVIQIFVRDAEALVAVMEDMKTALTPDHVVLCHSTVNSWGIRRAVAIADSVGAAFLDAPFTGSKTAAEKGQLVYYIGGDQAPLDRARKVLETSGKKIITLGKAGDATVLKIATNLISAAVIEALAEAMAITKAEGIDVSKLQEALADNANSSALLTMKLPTMAARSYAPHFSLKNMLKDARYAQAIADEKGLALPVLNASALAMDRGVRSGQGEFDYSVVLENFAPMLRAVEERAARFKAKEAAAVPPPTPVEAAPVEPTPVEPTPAEPTPAEPTPAEPTPAEPTPAEPTPAEPTPAEPTPAAETPPLETEKKKAEADAVKTEEAGKVTPPADAAAEKPKESPLKPLAPTSASADAPSLAKKDEAAKDKAAPEPSSELPATITKDAEKAPAEKEISESKDASTATAETKDQQKDEKKEKDVPEIKVAGDAPAEKKEGEKSAAEKAQKTARDSDEKKAEPDAPTPSGLPKPPAIAKAGLKPSAPGSDKTEDIPDSKLAEGTADSSKVEKPSSAPAQTEVAPAVKQPSFVSRLFRGITGRGKKDKQDQATPPVAKDVKTPDPVSAATPLPAAPAVTGKDKGQDKPKEAAKEKDKTQSSPPTAKSSGGSLAAVLATESREVKATSTDSEKPALPPTKLPPPPIRPVKTLRPKNPAAPATTLVAKLLSDTDADDGDDDIDGPAAITAVAAPPPPSDEKEKGKLAPPPVNPVVAPEKTAEPTPAIAEIAPASAGSPAPTVSEPVSQPVEVETTPTPAEEKPARAKTEPDAPKPPPQTPPLWLSLLLNRKSPPRLNLSPPCPPSTQASRWRTLPVRSTQSSPPFRKSRNVRLPCPRPKSRSQHRPPSLHLRPVWKAPAVSSSPTWHLRRHCPPRDPPAGQPLPLILRQHPRRLKLPRLWRTQRPLKRASPHARGTQASRKKRSQRPRAHLRRLFPRIAKPRPKLEHDQRTLRGNFAARRIRQPERPVQVAPPWSRPGALPERAGDQQRQGRH